MKPRAPDPRHLDVEAFADQGATLEGGWLLSDLPRLFESAAPEAPPAADDAARWSVEGEARKPRGGVPQWWLHVRAEAEVAMVCQRCLRPVREALRVERSVCFVRGEEAAEALDNELEDDVLALERGLDLRELVEDELLLALPLVPRHAVCPEPLAAPEEAVEGDSAPHPFAALAALRRGGSAS